MIINNIIKNQEIMGILSTQDIPREKAIHRIKKIYNLVQEKDYQAIEKITNESDYSLQDFVNTGLDDNDIENIEKFTNQMIENIMDEPFFRYAFNHNYYVYTEET